VRSMIGIWEMAVLLILIYLIFWVIAFVDIMKSEFRGNDKIIWLLAMIFAPILGLVCYFIIGRKQKVDITKG
jgi:hypothetical protein